MSILKDIAVMKSNSQFLMNYVNYSFSVFFYLSRKYQLDLFFMREPQSLIADVERFELKKWDDKFNEPDIDLFLKLMLICIDSHCISELYSDKVKGMIMAEAKTLYIELQKCPPLEVFSTHEGKLHVAIWKKLWQKMRKFLNEHKSKLPPDFVAEIYESHQVFHSCVEYVSEEVFEGELPV
jgi:hypothetical protein